MYVSIKLYGIVQGVGFRPFVARLAGIHAVFGTVANRGSYVDIRALGTASSVRHFLQDILTNPPPQANILYHTMTELPLPALLPSDFTIVESAHEEGSAFISPDLSICPTCERELYTPSNRRYLHPFINCTACGPRLTILDSLPYDRERTSMAAFPMCPSCAEEYHAPSSRRYDAQPVCCHDCGPELYLLHRTERGDAALHAAREALRAGKIVAVKGIGGFHLSCDAKNEAAVHRLRERKRRPAKPFAVMLRNLAAASREVLIPEGAKELLTGTQKPIVILDRCASSQIAPSVAPDNPTLGVMLPYTPLHHLLFHYPGTDDITDSLVMTSANPTDAPICRTDKEAETALTDIADLILSHNRAIRISCDDSVILYREPTPVMIRRSRGYAPFPLFSEEQPEPNHMPPSKDILALGGELKNTFCLGKNNLLYPSPHIGNLSDLRTVQAMEESIHRLSSILEIKPALVAADLHPRYQTTHLAKKSGLPVLPVQHHYAHILSCMAEHRQTAPVLGIALDGTGYGTDGTIWGGEILLASLDGFSRVASIAPFSHIGGDLSSKEGWRIALSMLYDAYGSSEAKRLSQALVLTSEKGCSRFLMQAEKRLNTITSTSTGRLFDAVSALLNIRRISTFEGEAAMALQFAAERCIRRPSVPNIPLPRLNLTLRKLDGRYILPTDALFLQIAERIQTGEDADTLAYFFHHALADLFLQAVQKLREEHDVSTVALSGGVFCNRLLLRLISEGLTASGCRVLTHREVPPNDGGLSLGQAYYALHHQRKGDLS
ncbi:carbamoyltransferase HypF [Selenomonas sp. TAMA-11512]|uniref:carbamoyltransferase HypF n=1 Tax=Selenomonas sp. TAMA-11512 TaxID=3095337 RepID=UPI0030917DFB|nr:carbamoyltransferase HypF [Selenomonas sp. TAMA-11512]